MATASPMPGEPSFSRSRSTSRRRPWGSSVYTRETAAQSSASTPALSVAARSPRTRSSRRNSATLIVDLARACRAPRLYHPRVPAAKLLGRARRDAVRDLPLGHGLVAAGRDQAEVAVLAPVNHVHVAGALRAREDEEVVVEQIHLHQRLLDRHGLGEELVAADDVWGDALDALGLENLVADAHRLGRVHVQGPVALQALLVLLELALDLVHRHVDGRVHVLALLLAADVEMPGVQVDVRVVEVALERERDVHFSHLVEVLADHLVELLLHVVAQSVGGEHVPEGDVDLHAG